MLWNNPLPLTSYVLYVSKPALLLCYRQEHCICIEEKLAALYLCWSGADRRSQLQEARHRGEQELKGSRNLKQEKHRPPNLQQRGKGQGCWFHAWNGVDSDFHIKGRKPHKAGEQGWGQTSVNLHSILSMFYGLCVKLDYLLFLRRCVFPEINLFLRFLISINLYL